jgi:hypothetical protein
LQACPNPTKTSRGHYRLADMQCFPWFIVELKKTGVPSQQEGYCARQAANAAQAALMLLQTAAEYAQRTDEDQHVPPVVAMTTTGKAVDVWIAFYQDQGGQDAYVSASEASNLQGNKKPG